MSGSTARHHTLQKSKTNTHITMKKILSIITLCIVAVALALPAQAQSFSWGITGGLNMTKLKMYGSFKEASRDFQSDNKCGWYIGPKVEFNTVLGIGVDAALEYSQRDLNISTTDVNGMPTSESEKYRTIEIPVNLRYNIGLGKLASVYVATGPQFGFALNNMKWGNIGSGDNFSRSNLNTTWNIGAGVRLLKHLEVGVGYNFALGKAGKAMFQSVGGTVGSNQDYQLKYKTNTFQVQVAYLF